MIKTSEMFNIISLYAEAAESHLCGKKIRMPKNYLKVDPEWKRKKCKSCSHYNPCLKYGTCAYPNHKACNLYSKK